jgi:uncharacterized membrane protein
MKRRIVAFALTLVLFGLLDAIWLSSTYDALYRPVLGPLMAVRPDPVAAILFYAVFIAGLVHFGVEPGLKDTNLLRSGLRCAFFGFCAYATYDLTNQATLARWSWRLTLADLVWGAVASGLAGAAASRIVLKLRLAEGNR